MSEKIIDWCLSILLGGFLVYGLYYATSADTLAREKAQAAEHKGIHYIKDPRTGLCFATKRHWRGMGMARVDCTPKVKALIDG